MLVPVTDIEKVLEKYDHDLRRAGNQVYWLQRRECINGPTAFPITNVYADEIEYRYDMYTVIVRYDFTEYAGVHGFKYPWRYNKNWRLFDFPPTKEELNLPWNE